jgi:thiol-disulfide isomerase/thioredoxin
LPVKQVPATGIFPERPLSAGCRKSRDRDNGRWFGKGVYFRAFLRNILELVMKLKLAVLALSVASLAISGISRAQEEENSANGELTIGSVAPQLDIEHWVQNGEGKFGKVTKFEDGKVYVVEFWATWCGPCVASMPHISELQTKYADRGLQIISVSDEDLETVDQFLDRKVRGEDDKTYRELTRNYCLTTDPDGTVSRDYMEAASQNGIPTAFVVGKTGRIEWIGHPMSIDEPISKVIDDTWDRETFAVAFREEQQLQTLLMKLSRKMQDGKADEVIADLTEAIEQSKSETVVNQLKSIRTQVIISTGAEGAADEIRKLAAASDANATMLNSLAWSIVEKQQGGDEVRDDLIAAAIEASEKAIVLEPQGGHIVDTLAHLVYIQGDLDRAIELAEKAMQLSGDEFPEIGEFLKQLKAEKEKGKIDQ